MTRTHREQVAAIPTSRTRPELVLAAHLEAMGQSVEMGTRVTNVKVDIVLPELRTAVFVDGCFWHGCPEHYVRPRSNAEFWATKLAANVARDQIQTAALKTAFWNVIRIWEHEVSYDPAGAAGLVLARSQTEAEPPSDLRVVRVEIVSVNGTELEERHHVTLQKSDNGTIVRRPRTTSKRWRP